MFSNEYEYEYDYIGPTVGIGEELEQITIL
jgi:hypothetical protein